MEFCHPVFVVSFTMVGHLLLDMDRVARARLHLEIDVVGWVRGDVCLHCRPCIVDIISLPKRMYCISFGKARGRLAI